MTSAQVVVLSVNIIDRSHFQDNFSPCDLTTPSNLQLFEFSSSNFFLTFIIIFISLWFGKSELSAEPDSVKKMQSTLSALQAAGYG